MPATPVVFAFVCSMRTVLVPWRQTVVMIRAGLWRWAASSTKFLRSANHRQAQQDVVPGVGCHMHVGDDYTGVQELSLGVPRCVIG